jgi:hypothetical protein
MSQSDTLQLHQQLCDEVYQCVLDENRSLRLDPKAPYPELLTKKRGLLARLDQNLRLLRDLPAVSSRDTAALAQLERARSRILQILQLDKENEQLMLRSTAAGPATPASVNSSALLKRIYSRSS